MCKGQARLFPGITLNMKKDTWLMDVHMQDSVEMCPVSMHAAVSKEPSGGQDAQPCSSTPRTKPEDIPVALSPKAGVRTAPVLLSVLTSRYGSRTKHCSWMWMLWLLEHLFWQPGRHPRAELGELAPVVGSMWGVQADMWSRTAWGWWNRDHGL